MEMKDFHSKSLNKTFPSIIFSGGIAGSKPASPHGRLASSTSGAADPFAAAVQAEKKAATQSMQSPQASGGSQGAVAPFSEIQVEKAAGENSYTVAEIFEQLLRRRPRRVRGKVVKFNANIMGRNWLHLQDGSGDPMQNTHDLVVTTTSEVGSPEVVTVEGVLAADRDFGAGYKYIAIVESADIIE